MSDTFTLTTDGFAYINRVARRIDLSGLDPNIHAVQWDGTRGHIEFKDRSPNQNIDSITRFQTYIDRWVAAVPVPAQPSPQDQAEKQARQALRGKSDNAPITIKDLKDMGLI